MKSLLIIFASVVASLGSNTIAQPIAPRALYNPESGGIWFDQLDSILEEGRGTLRIMSLADGRFVRPYIVGRNGVALEIESEAPTSPVGYSDTVISWHLAGLSNEPIDEPVFAGYIVKPGTAPTDLYLQAFAGRIAFPTSNAIPIPEPSTLLLILAGAGWLVLGRNK